MPIGVYFAPSTCISVSSALLEQRIISILKGEGVNAEAKKMFGGVAFMIRGNISVGITNKGDFMARFDPVRHEEILQWPGAKPMTFGKPASKGFLFVDASAVESDASLKKWVRLSLEFIATLPEKKKTTAAKRNAAQTPAKRSVANKATTKRSGK